MARIRRDGRLRQPATEEEARGKEEASLKATDETVPARVEHHFLMKERTLQVDAKRRVCGDDR